VSWNNPSRKLSQSLSQPMQRLQIIKIWKPFSYLYFTYFVNF